MVARDVVDDIRYDGFAATSTPRKESPERPGYPRGIPGLREEERGPKAIPAAGKPSRPPSRQRERSPVER